MIIACDIDNVICNLQEVVTNLFNERYDTKYTLDKFNTYNIENVLSVKEANTMKEIYGENGIYDIVKPIVGSQDALQKLIKAGHSVYLVTDAIPKIYNEKVEWVKHFFPFIDEAHIISMKHKHLFKCDIMIEDNLNNLLSGHHYERICLDYPWNRDVRDYVYNIHRCSNWNEITNAINKLN
jgi:5'(3')-deoxyribonucleotidase